MTTLPQTLDEAELREQVRQADVVVDGCDNLPARLAINAACVRAGVPLVSGAAIRLEGRCWSGGRAGGRLLSLPVSRCRCGPETCAQTGVLAPVVGIVGSIQALEAIKVLTDFGRRSPVGCCCWMPNGWNGGR